MRFTLQNLGRLREATIDLGKDLVLLTGPNNTSKTYVAHTIYGSCALRLPKLGRLIEHRIVTQSMTVDRMEIDIRASILDPLPSIVEEFSREYESSLPVVLACEQSFTSRSRIILEFTADELESIRRSLIEEPIDRDIPLDRARKVRFQKQAGSEAASAWYIQANMTTEPASVLQSRLASYAVAILSMILEQKLFAGLVGSWILSAERAAIQLFSRELSFRRSELVDEMLDAGLAQGTGLQSDTSRLLQKNARRYPLPIRDGLEIAETWGRNDLELGPMAHLADALERDVLQGALRVNDQGDLTFRPEGSDAPLDLHLSSSSVKALAPLSFYLRHMARPGQFLIIDEPELNLHPDNQRRVARLLGRLAHAGIKVMISTHSDYIVREINNLIMLSADQSGELRKKHGYAEEEILSPDRVGAYLFDATTAHPIEVKPTGIEVETIDRAINELNQISQDIFFSLFPNAS